MDTVQAPAPVPTTDASQLNKPVSPCMGQAGQASTAKPGPPQPRIQSLLSEICCTHIGKYLPLGGMCMSLGTRPACLPPCEIRCSLFL